MDKKPIIVFSIELSQRELEGKLFIALEALRRGYLVYVTDFFGARLLSREYESGLVFFHKCSGVRNLGYRSDTGHSFVFLDEEFGPAVPHSHLVGVRRRDKLSPAVHSIIFTASPAHTKATESWAEGRGLNIQSIGWPKLDMMAASFSPKSLGSEPNSRHILFAASFGNTVLGRFLEGHFLAPMEQLSQSEKDQRLISAVRQNEKLEMLEAFVAAIVETSRNFEVTLRPHNSEHVWQWKEILNRYGLKIRIDQDEPLSKVIKRSRAVVHPGSTVGIQAVLLNVPSFLLSAKGTVKDTLMYEVSKSAQNGNDLLELLEESKSSDQSNYWTSVRAALEVYAPSLRGSSSAAKIMDSIATLNVAPQHERVITRLDKLVLSLHWLFRRFIDRDFIRRLLGKGVSPRVYTKLQGGLELERIQNALAGLKSYGIVDADRAVCKSAGQNIVSLRNFN